MQKTIYLLLVLFAISCINASRNQAKSIISDNPKNLSQMATDKDFQTFWSDFRNAIISMDYIKLIGLTNFPLEAHGRRDEDPKFLIHKGRFYYFLRKCLNEDSGMSTDGETNLDFITRTPILEEGKYYMKSKNRYKVAAMEFQSIDNCWKLTRIYFDTIHYKDQ